MKTLEVNSESIKEFIPQIADTFINWACDKNYDLTPQTSTDTFMTELETQNVTIVYMMPNVDATEIVVKIGEKLPEMDIARGSVAGFFIGSFGEKGYATKDSTYALLNFFIKIVNLCVSLQSIQDQSQANLIANHPDEYKAALEMPLLSTAIMSRITTAREYRDFLRLQEGFRSKIESIANLYGNTRYIPGILNMVEKETVYMLHLELNKGCEVEIEQMDNNFQIFTWFQMELYHQGLLNEYGVTNYNYNPKIDQLIHRSFDQHQDYFPIARQLTDESKFGYYQYTARTVNKDNTVSYRPLLVFGEGNIYEVPKLDDKFVILLTEKTTLANACVTRNWNGAFIGGSHQNLNPKLRIVRQLSPKEVEEWRLKIDQK